MATNAPSENHDWLGMKRFALTEAAQDLLNRLQGVYGRLAFEERRKSNPDWAKMAVWQQHSEQIARRYWALNWDDLACVEQFILEMRTELQTVSQPNPTPILVYAG